MTALELLYGIVNDINMFRSSDKKLTIEVKSQKEQCKIPGQRKFKTSIILSSGEGIIIETERLGLCFLDEYESAYETTINYAVKQMIIFIITEGIEIKNYPQINLKA